MTTITNSAAADYGGWPALLNPLELRREVDAVRCYSYENHNYIVFPDGLFVENCGLDGDIFMNKIQEEGKDAVRRDLLELARLTKKIGSEHFKMALEQSSFGFRVTAIPVTDGGDQ